MESPWLARGQQALELVADVDRGRLQAGILITPRPGHNDDLPVTAGVEDLREILDVVFGVLELLHGRVVLDADQEREASRLPVCALGQGNAGGRENPD